MVVEKMVEHLGPKRDEESNLNASTIIQDMIEMKQYYSYLVTKENIE